jgi:hypothetical protein
VIIQSEIIRPIHPGAAGQAQPVRTAEVFRDESATIALSIDVVAKSVYLRQRLAASLGTHWGKRVDPV